MNISTNTILNALQYYRDNGFNLLDVPLIVDSKVSNFTKPKQVPNLHHSDDKVYVASAEQSFLQLLQENKQMPIYNAAITPCYRHERYLNDLSYLIFLKIELFTIGNKLDEIIDNANDFMSNYLDTKIVHTEDGYDIVHLDSGIELGSYGTRTFYGIHYTYGTGLAEPRFTHACNYKKV